MQNIFHQPTLEERKARIRATRPDRQRSALHQQTHGRGFPLGVVMIGIVILIVVALLLTSCAGGSQYAQVFAEWTFVYGRDGQAIAVIGGAEYAAPNPLVSGCYLLRRPLVGDTGSMELVDPFYCGGSN